MVAISEEKDVTLTKHGVASSTRGSLHQLIKGEAYLRQQIKNIDRELKKIEAYPAEIRVMRADSERLDRENDRMSRKMVADGLMTAAEYQAELLESRADKILENDEIRRILADDRKRQAELIVLREVALRMLSGRNPDGSLSRAEMQRLSEEIERQ